MDTRRCSWAALPLRLALGFGMAYHGYPKLFSAAEREQFVGMLGGIGVPAPVATAWAVGVLEFVGGLLLILGALTALLSVLFVIEMLVAWFTVHLPSGFNFMNITGMSDAGPVFGLPGYEVNVLYIAGFLALLIGGPGRYSVDSLFGRRAHAPGEEGTTAAARNPFAERRPSWRRRTPRASETPPPS